MRVLVTGGAGFIGSHLVEELLLRSHQVSVLDNLSTGKLSNLPTNGAVRFVEGDVADRANVDEALNGVDAVVHLAAVASVQASVENPVLTNRSNLAGTINLLQASAEAHIGHFLYAGSAAVYGDQNVDVGVSISESAMTLPQSPYAIDKLAGEQYLGFYHATGRLHGTGFRFFNVYGPRQDPSSPYSGVISIFHERLAAGLPLHFYGDGEQTRDFVFVGDLVELLAKRLEQPPAPSRRLPIVNVGSGRATSLKELVNHLADALSVQPAIVYEPPRLGDIRHSLSDITVLRRMFGDIQLRSLADGLKILANFKA